MAEYPSVFLLYHLHNVEILCHNIRLNKEVTDWSNHDVDIFSTYIYRDGSILHAISASTVDVI